MSVSLKWFPPSWFQIKSKNAIIYIDPAYLRSYYTRHPKKIEFSRWPDPIGGLPAKPEKANLVQLTHTHKDHAREFNYLYLSGDRFFTSQTQMDSKKERYHVVLDGCKLTESSILRRCRSRWGKAISIFASRKLRSISW